ncbi:MoaD/ThiS family protein [Stutzerimonas kirkiae]|uniref:Molybdopterin synthase sulfur carrier subunit n=1 Tax=Stutzerimonas kirkiae TaxID=2211392 RepID=A0A4Q9R860_9GAMM|nr:MoaD/ThiS family protein [Stutzerimonas kirkiae]TBU96795.1 molybdopterin synthase sulfur carrier subunit [Stutzerimonas kirkiae]TBV01035.1 molybdopterin synthase sulfur carrier subunit [Stutzerimonas kirkiae]TBV08383.1 molybdopterin synthase sulfur carrier subunit [Stutzerimonas kirkiae]TBV16654.1 molybdopterin synthase sulfur carrier subunit [Stutzerimonas kirkiae]
MSISVIVPTLLRPLTHGEKNVSVEGNSVAEAIDNLESRFPGIKARLISDDRVHRFVNIYVNEDDIRFADGLDTPIKAGDSLTVLPAVAGG